MSQHNFEKNGLLSPSQSGFRKNRSTEDQVTLLTQDIENGFQQKMKTLAVFVDLTKAFDKVWKEGLLFKLLRKRVCGNMYSWIQSYLFQRSARVRLDGQTSSSVKIREEVPQGGVISPTLFIIFIDDICDQLSSHIPRVLHADDLPLWTKAEQVTTAAIRMQKAMNLISDWAKEWLVMINRTKTEATCFSLSPKRRVHSADQRTRNPPARHPNLPRSEVRQKTDLVSPHQYHAQQRSQENGPDEETGRNKMGSQHENLDPGLHRNCQTPHGVCLQCLVICCKD